MVISMTGGTSWNTWLNYTGAAIDFATHQAIMTVRTWTRAKASQSSARASGRRSRGWQPSSRRKNAVFPSRLQPGPRQPPENQKSETGRERGKIDEQQRRPTLRITDQVVAPRQARDDDDRKRDQADGAIDEDGIGRRTPSGPAARQQPEPTASPPIEEGSV